MQRPIVSVLMTAYNREKYIAEAIESVMESTFTDFELVVVDDCSNDGTVDIAKKYEAEDKRVKVYVNERNLGDYPNRNKAASYAKGKYIKYLDSDDIMYPHCLQVMVSSMEKFPEAGFGLSAIQEKKRPYPVCLSPHDSYLEHFHGYGHFDRAPGSAVIKKSVFDDMKGFSGARHIGDSELWFKMAQKYYMVKFPPDLYWSRAHPNSESAVEKKSNFEQIRKRMISTFVNSPNCPINAEEIIKPVNASVLKKVMRKISKTE